MKANPGGVIDPRNVYGRDRLIESLWQRLDHQCVLMHAERRIGKTSILRKMKEAPPAGWFPVLLDLARVENAEEFAVVVYDEVQRYLGLFKRTANLARKIYEENEFNGFRRIGRPRPWKSLLTALVHDLLARKRDWRLVFLWDELPYMLENIRRQDGEKVTLEVLDTLRSLRQENHGLRMVFSGSIGLHHVLESLRDGKNSSEPINDMRRVEIPPLATSDAISLAGELIRGENLEARDIAASAAVIADEADGFPFYIHNIVTGLKQEGRTAEPAEIRSLVGRHLNDSNDPWDLKHYRNRIPVYYDKGQDAECVRLILDALATAPGPMAIDRLQGAINATSAGFDDWKDLIRVLRLMELDHYLIRDEDGRFGFRFPLIRRWWTLDRGL